jgi:hypothetical protein
MKKQKGWAGVEINLPGPCGMFENSAFLQVKLQDSSRCKR